MKKILAILIAACMLAGIVCIPTFAADMTTLKVVYLNGTTGEETNSGMSTADPVGTLVTAYERLGDEGGIICVCGDTVVDDLYYDNNMDSRPDTAGNNLTMPAHSGKVYITSINGAKLQRADVSAATTISMGGDTEFFNITIESLDATQNWNFYAYGNELTFGRNVQLIGPEGYNTGSGKGFNIHGFAANPENGLEADPVINIYSGTFEALTLAGTKGAGTLYGTATANLYSGAVNKAVDGGGAGGLIGTSVVNVYSDFTIGTRIGANTKAGLNEADETDKNFYGCTANLYGAAVANIVTADHVTRVENVAEPPILEPDSTYFTLIPNDTPPTDWQPPVDSTPTETDPIIPEDTDPITPEDTDPITPPETDPQTPVETKPQTPAQTQKPSAGTEKPADDGGCGSVIASGLAIVAVVSLAGVALAKKKD